MTQPKNGPFGAPSPRPGPTASGGDRPPVVTPPEPVQVPVEAATGDNTGSVSPTPEQKRTRFWQDAAKKAARSAHETAKRAEQLENEADQLRRRVAALEAYRPGVRGFRPGPLLADHVDPGDNSAFARLRRRVIAGNVELDWRISQLEERLQEYQQADEAQTARIQAMEQALEEIVTCAGVHQLNTTRKLHETFSYLASVAAVGLAGTYPDAPQSQEVPA